MPNTFSLSLADTLGLKPLDRVLINSAHEISEARCFARQSNQPFDLPWFYFQRVIGDKLEVRSPGGYSTTVDPLDVCDVSAGKPLVVQAMPMAVYLERLALPFKARQEAAPATSFCDADVLYAEKGRYRDVSFMVWFHDSAMNQARPTRAILQDGCNARLVAFARRTRMPVASRSGANHSADHGVSSALATARVNVAEFFKQRLVTACEISV